MNVLEHRDASFLNIDEASAIEAALRTALVSILKVFCEVNEKRSRCYEVKLAQAERENTALKFQLQSAEQELQSLRQNSSNYKISAEVNLNHDFIPETNPDEEPASFSESDVVRVLKEEEDPFYHSNLFVKSENVTGEYSARALLYPDGENEQICQQPTQIQTHETNHHHHHQQHQRRHSHSLTQDPVLTGLERRRLTRYENVRRYRERIRADPAKYLAWKQKNHLRYLQNRKTINELPEPLKNLQRKAWREATRRHRAKKQAQSGFPAVSMSQTHSL